ncbi:uncharacterized protein MAM_05859 [Metarhizium album ARSEF 1941]|uniref:Uncharacterized protein n=1 Tax=Metarhizium album (strain ARSEF 1941) TaxID=1081103 RepID=A0A0B2WQI8_METAS|nr:uncharacterized protein MAM_05859 [Metarhizium album ARSEF 1941]KHN96273.1 hypothetical protein MAM_05859 [Metarhizium album ARSEF 1941]
MMPSQPASADTRLCPPCCPARPWTKGRVDNVEKPGGIATGAEAKGRAWPQNRSPTHPLAHYSLVVFVPVLRSGNYVQTPSYEQTPHVLSSGTGTPYYD